MNRFVFSLHLWLQVGPLALRTGGWPLNAIFIRNRRSDGYSYTAWWLRLWFVAISWRW